MLLSTLPVDELTTKQNGDTVFVTVGKHWHFDPGSENICLFSLNGLTNRKSDKYVLPCNCRIESFYESYSYKKTYLHKSGIGSMVPVSIIVPETLVALIC